jgi:hypothetical protein
MKEKKRGTLGGIFELKAVVDLTKSIVITCLQFENSIFYGRKKKNKLFKKKKQINTLYAV